jgi:putative hydrolase of the HAD superfamily
MGTLVTLRPPAPLLRRELRGRFGIQVSEREARAALAAEIAFYRRHMGDGRDAGSLQRLRLRCASALAGALPAASTAQSLSDDEVLGALLASLRFAPFGDARGALLAARAAGVRVVVVSNWDVSVLEVLESTGLSPLLDGVVCSAVLGVAKPAPEMFERALAIAGVPAAAAMHVGDSATEDVAGALAAGIEPVLIDRVGAAPRIDGVRTIATLAALDWSSPVARGAEPAP